MEITSNVASRDKLKVGSRHVFGTILGCLGTQMNIGTFTHLSITSTVIQDSFPLSMVVMDWTLVSSGIVKSLTTSDITEPIHLHA